MESYYATAHKIKEKIVAQHSSMGGGDPNLQLKPYQATFNESSFIFEVLKWEMRRGMG